MMPINLMQLTPFLAKFWPQMLLIVGIYAISYRFLKTKIGASRPKPPTRKEACDDDSFDENDTDDAVPSISEEEVEHIAYQFDQISEVCIKSKVEKISDLNRLVIFAERVHRKIKAFL